MEATAREGTGEQVERSDEQEEHERALREDPLERARRDVVRVRADDGQAGIGFCYVGNAGGRIAVGVIGIAKP